MFPVEVEERAGDYNSCPAKGESDIGLCVVLSEVDGSVGKVDGKSIVGGVFQVYKIINLRAGALLLLYTTCSI